MEAAKSVLVELVHVLGEYRDDMVVVGGWVPPLLMPDSSGHVGSTDVDVALNHLAENDEAYARISKLLKDRGYEQDERAALHLVSHSRYGRAARWLWRSTSLRVNTAAVADSIGLSRSKT